MQYSRQQVIDHSFFYLFYQYFYLWCFHVSFLLVMSDIICTICTDNLVGEEEPNSVAVCIHLFISLDCSYSGVSFITVILMSEFDIDYFSPNRNERCCPCCKVKSAQKIKLYPVVCDFQKKTLKSAFGGIETALSALNDSPNVKDESDFDRSANILLNSVEPLMDFDCDNMVNMFFSCNARAVELGKKLTAKDRRLERMKQLLVNFKRQQKKQVRTLYAQRKVIGNLKLKLQNFQKNGYKLRSER